MFESSTGTGSDALVSGDKSSLDDAITTGTVSSLDETAFVLTDSMI